jgi:hypothetical protein
VRHSLPHKADEAEGIVPSQRSGCSPGSFILSGESSDPKLIPETREQCQTRYPPDHFSKGRVPRVPDLESAGRPRTRFEEMQNLATGSRGRLPDVDHLKDQRTSGSFGTCCTGSMLGRLLTNCASLSLRKRSPVSPTGPLLRDFAALVSRHGDMRGSAAARILFPLHLVHVEIITTPVLPAGLEPRQ